MSFIFDACALIAYLRDETGADVLEEILLDPEQICLVHAINLCEVYYDFLRISSGVVAQEAVQDVLSMGLILHEDMDRAFWQAAGKLKARHRLSLADCFALAFTQRINGTLLTSDHHEFDPIDQAGICEIHFFR